MLFIEAPTFNQPLQLTGICMNIAVSKHEHWSSVAPLPFEVVISAGQKAREESWDGAKLFFCNCSLFYFRIVSLLLASCFHLSLSVLAFSFIEIEGLKGLVSGEQTPPTSQGKQNMRNQRKKEYMIVLIINCIHSKKAEDQTCLYRNTMGLTNGIDYIQY